MKKIDIDDIALLLHINSDYDGFQCWELEHIYKNFLQCRLPEFRKHFEEVCSALVEKQVKNKLGYVEEWSIEVKKIEKFPNSEYKDERDRAYSYYLSGSLSSQDIRYECSIEWPKDEMKVKCFDYKGEKMDEFVLHLWSITEVNFTHYQRLSRFSNWFYRLYGDWLQSEKRNA